MSRQGIRGLVVALVLVQGGCHGDSPRAIGMDTIQALNDLAEVVESSGDKSKAAASAAKLKDVKEKVRDIEARWQKLCALGQANETLRREFEPEFKKAIERVTKAVSVHGLVPDVAEALRKLEAVMK